MPGRAVCEVFVHQPVLRGAAQWVEMGGGFPLPSRTPLSDECDVNETVEW